MLSDTQRIPELKSSSSHALQFLENHFLTQCPRIKEWFAEQWKLTPPPVYGSVDLRNAGFKLAPIDMNLFPAGFNNLNPAFLAVASDAAKKVIRQTDANAKKILLIPESHTRNLLYWENIQALIDILAGAGFETRIGTLSEEVSTPQTINTASGKSITIAPLLRRDNQLQLAAFVPEVILLNNDLSGGIPDILQRLQQPLIPPAELGWSQRLKSEHFQYYAEVAADFAAEFKLDPWMIAPLFRHCGQIDFMEQAGMECLIVHAEALFRELRHKYEEYKIDQQPFLIVKADAGTYGMAVMTVRNVDELRQLNRKQRTRMSTIKGGQPVRKVIIQEGVYTFETLGDGQAVAEPVVYLWGDTVVGGFYRVHKERGVDENLNAPGMHFEPLAFPKTCHEPCSSAEQDPSQNRFYTYGIVAQLSMLAAAREIKGFKP